MKNPMCRRLTPLLAAASLFCAAAPLRADYSSTVLSDNPAGYWRLGEMPVTFDDVSVLATNQGSLATLGTGWFTGYVRRNQAGALAGSTDTAYRFWVGEGRVTVTNSAFDFTGTTPFTLEVWAKPMLVPTSTQTQRLLSNGSSGVGYGFSLYGPSNLRMTGFGVADVTSDAQATPFATNQWYHLVVVRSNTFLFFYVNGVQLGAVKSLSNIKTTPNPLAFGTTAVGGEGFSGCLDEPAVYTNVLAPDRIAAHYSAGITAASDYAGTVLTDSPIGYWRLNEPGKPESTTVIANSGSTATAANGAVFGSLNSVTGGAPGAPVGDANTAMGFAGTNGKIDVPQNAALNTPSFTVECWAKVATWANTHQSPVTSRHSGGAAGSSGYILYAAPGTSSAPRWEFWTGPGWDTVPAAEADFRMNEWTHLVGTYDAATGMKLFYIDGRLVTGKANVSVSTNSLDPLRIGAGASENGNGSFFLNGAVDEVAIYPSVLPPARVLAHYESGAGSVPTTVVAPIAVTAPAAVTNWAPYPVTLSAVMSGTLPLTLQWYRVSPDGLTTNVVPNGTDLVLTLDPTSPTQTGNYFLSASNSAGYAETAQAWVEIIPLTAPTFVVNAPATVPVYVGGTAGIPTVATNTPPITYQWQSNSVDIANATNSILALPNVQASYSSASFVAKAMNRAGVTPSDAARLTILTPTAATYAAQATTLNPLAYWRLGEAAGTLAFDYWGGHPAVYVNTIQGSMPGGLFDNDDGAVTLMGQGSYIRTLESAPFSFSGFQDFTLTTFIKVNTAPAANTPVRIFSNFQGATTTNVSSGFGFGLYGMTKLRFTAFGVVDLDANVQSLTTDQWYHLAAVRSNNWVYLYINGALANNGAVGAIRASAFPLQIGGNPDATTTESFDGIVDEAAVFGRALTASEVTSLYNGRYGSVLPPSIVTQPTAPRLFAGGTARFNVQAVGSAPLSYLWKANNVPIPDATNSSLVITGVTLANNGVSYTVTVTNRAGTANSSAATLSVTQATGYSAAVVSDNPLALYRLGEASGPVAYDSWGGYNGLDNGAVTYGAPGALLSDPNTAATFDAGLNSKIELPYTPVLNPQVFSVEAWAKVTGGENTYRAVISARDEGSGFERGFIIYAASGNYWTFWVGDGVAWQALNGPAIVTNEWTHLAAVYDGQTKYFYVNGALVGTQTIPYVPNNLRPIRIGAGRNEFDIPPTGDPTLYWFTGNIDEVAIYNTVLSAERIAYHYALGIYGNSTAPFVVRQPRSQTVAIGTPVTLDPVVAGSPTLQYQWLKDGAPVPGATTSTLTFARASFANSGAYVLTVTNAVGYMLSSTAQLTVMPTPGFAMVTNDLVVHLKFDNDYADSSGRGNNATAGALGAPTFVPGRIGTGALHYMTDTTNGVYTYATLGISGTPPDLLFSSNVNFSVSFWVRFTGTPGDLPFICNAQNSYSNPGFTFAPSYQQGGWSWSLGNADGYIGVNGPAGSINDGNWHHLVHTFDRAAGAATTYLDGALANLRYTTVVADIDTGTIVNIGQDPTGQYQESGSADIDDIGIWRRALTTYDAQAMYAAGTNGASFDITGPVYLKAVTSGNTVDLYWQAGTLQQADEAAGTYTPVSGAQAPHYRVTPDAPRKFYKVKP